MDHMCHLRKLSPSTPLPSTGSNRESSHPSLSPASHTSTILKFSSWLSNDFEKHIPSKAVLIKVNVRSSRLLSKPTTAQGRRWRELNVSSSLREHSRKLA